jgi:hypothetical protein
MMAKKLSIVVLTLLGFARLGSAQQFLTDRNAFLATVEPGYYEEKFDGWSEGEPLNGHQSEWEGPGAGSFGLTVSAAGPGNNLLYSLDRAISTSAHDDLLVFRFSGRVYVFGGEFWGTMPDGFSVATEVTFKTENGHCFTRSVSGRTFLGFVSNVPMTSVTIDAAGAQAAWPTAGNLIVGDLKQDGDFDGDGMSNGAEESAGTDPTDPKSNLRVTAVELSDSGVVVRFPAVQGKTYRLEYKNALSDAKWLPSDAPDQMAAVSGSIQFVDQTMPRPASRFYRVALILTP